MREDGREEVVLWRRMGVRVRRNVRNDDMGWVDRRRKGKNRVMMKMVGRLVGEIRNMRSEVVKRRVGVR